MLEHLQCHFTGWSMPSISSPKPLLKVPTTGPPCSHHGRIAVCFILHVCRLNPCTLTHIAASLRSFKQKLFPVSSWIASRTETKGKQGGWVLLPRSVRPCFCKCAFFECTGLFQSTQYEPNSHCSIEWMLTFCWLKNKGIRTSLNTWKSPQVWKQCRGTL